MREDEFRPAAGQPCCSSTSLLELTSPLHKLNASWQKRVHSTEPTPGKHKAAPDHPYFRQKPLCYHGNLSPVSGSTLVPHCQNHPGCSSPEQETWQELSGHTLGTDTVRALLQKEVFLSYYHTAFATSTYSLLPALLSNSSLPGRLAGHADLQHTENYCCNCLQNAESM